jgi:hypothetical protein
MSPASALLRRGAAPTFSPASVGGLVEWHDASALTGLADGDPVASWTDRSTSGIPATQATSSKRPTYKTGIQNGLPVVRFDGVDDVLAAGTAVTVGTVFAVAKYSAATFTSYNGLLTETGSTVYMLLGSSGSNQLLAPQPTGTYYKNGTLTSPSTSGSGPMNAFALMAVTLSAGSIKLQIGLDRDQVSRFWNGDVAEIIAYNSILSTTDRQSVEAYLKAKWGTP